MTDILNTTYAIIHKLNDLHNVTNTNAQILLGCYTKFQSLKNSLTQKSEDQDSNTISSLEICFTYFSELHNKFAFAGNSLAHATYAHFGALREEKKEIHQLLCEKELKESKQYLKEAEETKDKLKLSLINQDGDNLNIAKDYYNAILKFNHTNSTFFSIQEKCLDAIDINKNITSLEEPGLNAMPQNNDTMIYTEEQSNTITEYNNITTTETIDL